MSVLEYAEDMNKKVEEVLKMCESLGIKVAKADDLLDDDRMLAEFATCISNIIGRSNFSV